MANQKVDGTDQAVGDFTRHSAAGTGSSFVLKRFHISDCTFCAAVLLGMGSSRETIMESHVFFVPESWMEREWNRLIERHRTGILSVPDIISAAWRLPDTAIAQALDHQPLSPEDQRRVLCRLQQQVARTLRDSMIGSSLEPRDPVESASQDQRFLFRPWASSDADRYVELLDNPRMWTYFPEPYPNSISRRMAEQLIEVSNITPTHEVRAVCHEGVVIGQVRLQFARSTVSPGTEIDDAEVSYWLGEPFWGKGLMTEILSLYTRRCFSQRPLLSITAGVRDENTGSIRVLEKAGYRYIGEAFPEFEPRPGVRVYRAFRDLMDI